MRDDAWKEAKAASEYEGWRASLRRANRTDKTVQAYAYTVQDLLAAHPEKEPYEFTAADCDIPERRRGWEGQPNVLPTYLDSRGSNGSGRAGKPAPRLN